MHISLDSALGQQRRLNSVGESITQIAPDPAAAYSLRSLTGGDPKVVRVRRASDNHEQDFTASDVSSGALQDFVNAQVTAPLDIQALSATGRDGDFLIAKAAYSLRSLGTRQATVTSSGDTAGDTSGKFVCQVRRDSDDALKSFTATEITDGTLLAFTNADYVKYTSDFSAGDNGWGSFDDVTETGNIDGIGGLDDNLRLAIGSATSQHRAFKNSILPVNQKINFSARVFIPSTNSVVDSLGIRDASGSVIIAAGTTPAQDEWVTITASNVTVTNASGQLRIDLQDGGVNNFAGNGSDVIYLREVVITQVTSDGFVKTWYDQSVTTQAGDTATGNHATQATAASQPKIVSAGSLNTDGGLLFDSSEFDLGSSVSLGSAHSIFAVAKTSTARSSTFPNLLTNPTNGRGVGIYSDAITDKAVAASNTDNSFNFSSNTNRKLMSVTSDATNVNGFENGAASSDNARSQSLTTNDFQEIGGGSNFAGTIEEIIVYLSDQTDNRTAIEANIGEAYSIDLPSGVDPGFDQVDGFVETWYDQSGNGRDSTNTTASQQPIIVEAGVFQDGLKFTHTDTTNGKRLFVPRTTADLGTEFALVWVGKVTSSTSTISNILGATRNVVSFATGTVGLSIKSNTGTSYFINEQTTSAREILLQSSVITLNEDSVVFANYDDASVLLSVDGSTSTTTFSSPVLTRAKNLGIMNATGNSTSNYRTQESPTGICREVLVYDTNQTDNRVALETNINNQYNLF